MTDYIDPITLILNQFSDPMNSYSIERGLRYDEYAQLRESKLQSKSLKLCEIESISEIPTSDYSPPVQKSVNFHDDLKESIKFLGNEEVCEIPKSDFSPILKKSVKFQGNEGVCEIPKSDYSPILKKSVKFHGNDRVSAIPKPGFLRKSVSFPVHSAENGQICEISPQLRKSVKFSPSRKENMSSNVNRIPKLEKTVTPPPPLKRERGYESGSSKYGNGNGNGGGKMVNSGEKQSSNGGGRKNVVMMMGRKSYASIEELKGLSIVAGSAINAAETTRSRKTNVLRKSNVFTTKYY